MDHHDAEMCTCGHPRFSHKPWSGDRCIALLADFQSSPAETAQAMQRGRLDPVTGLVYCRCNQFVSATRAVTAGGVT